MTLAMFATVALNGLTVAALYFIVASGFSLIFGLMRTVNMAHGSLYLIGAYAGIAVFNPLYDAGDPYAWMVALAAGVAAAAVAGVVLQVAFLGWMQGQEMRQTLVTIGLSIIAADQLLAVFGGDSQQFFAPDALFGATGLPFVQGGRYPTFRLFQVAVALAVGVGLWLVLHRTRLGLLVRAGVDDRAMLTACGMNVPLVAVVVFAIGAALAGLGGIIGGTAQPFGQGEGRAVPVDLARRRHRRRHGVDRRHGHRRVAGRHGRAVRSGAAAYLLGHPDAAAHGDRAGGAAAGNPRAAAVTATPLPAPIRSGATVLALAVAGVLVMVPLLVPAFWATNILGRAMVYGIIALSLTFLAHYGGFISLAQMVVAGVAGYTLAVTAPDAIPASGVRLPYAAAVPLALAMATTAGLLIGAIAVRTREIYLLMITLAIAVGFYYFVQTNLEYLNGYEGIRNVLGPEIFRVPFRNTYLFYYITLLTSLALYALVLYVAGSPFGLVLQGVRDNPRRAAALGYNVAMHRIGAFGFAGFVAGCGGVLSTIYNIGISPGQISTHATITILVMAVVGGLGHPIGAFAGALIYTLIDTFAASLYDRDRFNTLIGLVFLVVVLASPDGVVGLAAQARALFGRFTSPPLGTRRGGTAIHADSTAGPPSRPTTRIPGRLAPMTGGESDTSRPKAMRIQA